MIETSDKEPSLHPAYARVGAVLKQKWRLDKLLGIGGMAAVYAATHRNGNRVAIKVLHPELSKNLDVKTRFLREGYLANAVDHPGAVRVIDDDATEEGSVFLVMELLEGETLDRRWERKGKTLPVVEVLSIANELLDVLAAAHAKGLVHRDIKPENAFLTREGRVKILDFGIARLRELSAVNRSGTPTVNEGRATPTTLGGRVPALAASARSVNGRGVATTQVGATMGTPAFMPPEQARGRWDEVDARSDVWAAGATMFALLAGRFVHEAGTLNEQLLAAMTVSAPLLSSVLPDVHPAVAEVIDRALTFKKEDRWADARAMQVAIRQAYKASREPDAAIPAAPRFSEVDPDETLVMASPPCSDEDPAMTAQALASSPSAAPEGVPHRRSPWFVGFAAVAVGIAATALTFSRLPAPLRGPIAAAAAVAPIQTSIELSAPPVNEAPIPPRPADDVPVEDAPRPTVERPAIAVDAPAPPGTGLPQAVVAEPPAVTHAEPAARPESSSAPDHTRVNEATAAEHSRPDPSAHPAHRPAPLSVAPPAASATAEADESPLDPPAATAAPPSDSLLDRRH